MCICGISYDIVGGVRTYLLGEFRGAKPGASTYRGGMYIASPWVFGNCFTNLVIILRVLPLGVGFVMRLPG